MVSGDGNKIILYSYTFRTFENKIVWIYLDLREKKYKRNGKNTEEVAS
jgi:hypothetical protein